MRTISADPKIIAMANGLKLVPGDPVKEILKFCRSRIRGWIQKYGSIRSVLDLEVWRRAFADSWAPQVFAYAGDERPGGTIYARMFAPGLGIAEDPATGSAAVALAASLTMVAPRNGSMVWAIVQGVAMGRPSRITAGAVRSDRGLVGLTLAGQTVIVGDGVIRPH